MDRRKKGSGGVGIIEDIFHVLSKKKRYKKVKEKKDKGTRIDFKVMNFSIKPKK